MDNNKQDEAAAGNEAAQKSDKSPQELMQQVNNADTSLDSGPKKSIVDEMATETTTAKSGGERPKAPKPNLIKRITNLINIYLLIFLFLLALGLGIFLYSYFKNQRDASPKLETTELTEEALEELKTSDATVGDPRQILTIESHAVISGKVVLRDTLDVAGALNVGGPLSIQTIQSAGEANFNTIATNDLQAGGDVAIGGILDVADNISVGKELSVAGKITGGDGLEITGTTTVSGNFTVIGNLSTQSLTVSSLSFGKIDSSGPPPTVAVGGAAGGSGTASISGTDLAGSVTINTGGGTGTGTLATITFSSPYSSTSPNVVITPSGVGCASINYYVTNISASQFSIATANNAPAAATCRFNYIVIN